MKIIRQHYTPIQPTVCHLAPLISYQQVQPIQEIENFIYCFWQLKTNEILKHDFNYRVVSDGCIDIFFDHQNPEQNFVVGFHNKYTEFPIGKEFDYIGIRFLPAAFTTLFEIDAKTLSNQTKALKDVLKSFSTWISNTIQTEDTLEQIVEKLNQELKQKVANVSKTSDPRLLHALTTIFSKNGFIDTQEDLPTDLSSRQLLRLFNRYIGTSAKSFSNVVRFQYILKSNPTKESLKNNKLYYDVGFYDQSHFIKSFKTFYGVSPNQALY